MGVGAGLYMCDVVKKVHVRYLISWWVLVYGCHHCLNRGLCLIGLFYVVSDPRIVIRLGLLHFQASVIESNQTWVLFCVAAVSLLYVDGMEML